MKKLFTGYNKKYSDKYDIIFRKTLSQKLKMRMVKFIVYLFLKENK